MKTLQDLEMLNQAVKYVKTNGVATTIDMLNKIKENDLEVSDKHKSFVKYLGQLINSYNIIISRGGLEAAKEDYGNMIGGDEWVRLGTAIGHFELLFGGG